MTGKIIIFDLDGTIALIDHRRHFVQNGKNEWGKFYAACVDDLPNQPIIEIYGALSRSLGCENIEIWSGRSDLTKLDTACWLYANLPVRSTVTLKMRRHGDNTPDDELKERWLLEKGVENILMVFDDRDKVVNMWRKHGITCLQVAKGDF